MDLTRIDSPIGPLDVAVDGDALVALTFRDPAETEAPAAPPPRPGRRPGPVVAALRAYFDGDLAALDSIAVSPEIGTPFQRAVWLALREVPPGRTVSYSELAASVGTPRAVRAVGSANGANPTPVVVPCHRVVRADGTIGGYGGGLDRKRWLLAHEQRHA